LTSVGRVPILVALGLGPFCSAARPADPVILSLGDERVRRSDFERHVKAVEERGGPLDEGVRKALLEAFLEERVLVLEARRRRLLGARASLEDERAAAQRLLADAVKVEVGELEIEAYYRAHSAAFRSPETVRVRQLLLPSEAEAREALHRLRRDPKSFETLARSQSRGPEASTGGLMGSFSRGQLPPELEAVAFGLSPGTLSDVVRSPLGFHVLRLDARQPARERSLSEARDEIEALLAGEKTDRGVRGFVKELLSKAKVNHEAAQADPRRS